MKNRLAKKRMENELELINYLHAFWQYKWTAIVISSICMLFAVFYIRSSTPVFEAKGLIYPPTLANISSLNVGYNIKSRMQDKKRFADDAYGVFAYYLLANSTKEVFANELFSSTKINENSLQEALGDFYKTLSVRILPGNQPIKFLITAKGKDARQTVDWLEKYLAVANQRAINEILANSRIEKEKVINDLQNKIDAIKETTNNLANLNSDALLSSRLIKLETEINYYKKNSVDPVNVLLYRLDGKLEKPVIPVSPRKKMILILALSLGAFLSLIAIALQKLLSGLKAN